MREKIMRAWIVLFVLAFALPIVAAADQFAVTVNPVREAKFLSKLPAICILMRREKGNPTTWNSNICFRELGIRGGRAIYAEDEGRQGRIAARRRERRAGTDTEPLVTPGPTPAPTAVPTAVPTPTP